MAFEPTVFVVDDDERARKSVCAWFVPSGSGPKRFPPPKSFLPATPVGCPGCLVTDIRMTGMSGLDLQDRLIEQGIRLAGDCPDRLPANTFDGPRHEGRGDDPPGEALRRRGALGRHPQGSGPRGCRPRRGPAPLRNPGACRHAHAGRAEPSWT